MSRTRSTGRRRRRKRRRRRLFLPSPSHHARRSKRSGSRVECRRESCSPPVDDGWKRGDIVDPALIIFAIRALLRLGRAGSEAYSQYVRDRAILLPTLDFPPFDDIDFIRDVLTEPDQVWRLRGDGPLAHYWTGSGPDPKVPGAHEALYLAAVQVVAERKAAAKNLLPERGAEVAGEALVGQWAKGQGPVGPVARFTLTLVDVSLEYMGANPSILGIGGNGEKLVGALASNLAEMIPDDGDQFGPKSQFAERLLGIFLRAGLDALAQHPDAGVPNSHLEQLVRNVLPPVVQALPSDLAQQSQWRDVVQALMGPAARAAIDTVAANPNAFLGSEFDSNNVLGALTQALLKQASTLGLNGVLSEAGWLSLHRAMLGVAAERPELFVGKGKNAQEVAATLLGNVVQALQKATPPFDRDVGASPLVAVLDTVRTHGPRFAKDAWEADAAVLVGQVIGGLETALTDPTTHMLQSPLSRTQLVDFASVFATAAAATPGVLGDGSAIGTLVAGVARALGTDSKGRLSPADWLPIATAVAGEAFGNPAQLLRDGTGGAPLPCAALIQSLIKVATTDGSTNGVSGPAVLVGDTLREAIITAVHAGAGNADGIAAHSDAVASLAKELCDRVRAAPGRLGSKEWLWLFRNLVGATIDTGSFGDLGDQRVAAILAGGSGV